MKYVLMMMIVFGCSKDITTPEGLLSKFTKDITTQKMSRDYYYEHTTGKMKEDIEALSDEEFEKYRDLSRVKGVKIDILKKNCSGATSCTLTYIIKYEFSKAEKETTNFKSEVKKVAKLVQTEKEWKIEEVSNIKTYHESVEPINALEE